MRMRQASPVPHTNDACHLAQPLAALSALRPLTSLARRSENRKGGFSYLAWFANPLLLASIILLSLNRSRMALATSTASLILAATTFLIQKASFNEAGHMANVVGYGLGFYLWIASMSAILLTSVLSMTVGKAKRVIAPAN